MSETGDLYSEMVARRAEHEALPEGSPQKSAAADAVRVAKLRWLSGAATVPESLFAEGDGPTLEELAWRSRQAELDAGSFLVPPEPPPAKEPGLDGVDEAVLSDLFLADEAATLEIGIYGVWNLADRAERARRWQQNLGHPDRAEELAEIASDAKTHLQELLEQMQSLDPARHGEIIDDLYDTRSEWEKESDRWRELRDAERQAEEQKQREQEAADAAAAAASAELDTGHYDDGHGIWGTEPGPAKSWTNLTSGVDLGPDTASIEAMMQLEHEQRMEEPPPPTDGTSDAPEPSGNRKLVIGAVLIGVLGVALAVIVLLSGGDSGPSSNATDAPSDDEAFDGGADAAAPVRYESNCNGPCFMEVDPASCDRTFHFDLTILGDPSRFEGTTAVISTTGAGMQPTYQVPVANGHVVLDVVVPGAAYGGDPDAACGANAQWRGVLTSVDGQLTITPDPPT